MVGSHLYAVDLDGTLLTDRKTFDRGLMDVVLGALAERGSYLAIATGNQLPKVKQYLAGFEGHENLFFVADNGAVIHHAGEDLVSWGFPDDLMRETVGVLDRLFPGLGVIISCHSSSYVPAGRVQAMADLLVEHFEGLGLELPGYDPADPVTSVHAFYPGARAVGSLDDIGEQVVKIALNTPRPEDVGGILEKLAVALPAGVVATHSGFGAVDVIVEGNHKGHGVAWLAERLGLDAGAVTAFGDSPNDVEMFMFAGRAIGMEETAEALLPFTDFRIGSNNDGAVLEFIAGELGVSGC